MTHRQARGLVNDGISGSDFLASGDRNRYPPAQDMLRPNSAYTLRSRSLSCVTKAANTKHDTFTLSTPSLTKGMASEIANPRRSSFLLCTGARQRWSSAKTALISTSSCTATGRNSSSDETVDAVEVASNSIGEIAQTLRRVLKAKHQLLEPPHPCAMCHSGSSCRRYMMTAFTEESRLSTNSHFTESKTSANRE